MEQIFNKLVRDKIPEIIEGNGEMAVVRILNDEEFKTELERKMLEEYNEVLSAKTSKERLEELADMLEIIASLGTLEGSDLSTIMAIMEEKRKKRGGFSKKIFLEKTF